MTILLSTFIVACAPPKEEKPAVKPPVTVIPDPPAKPFNKRIQLNSGSSIGTTTNGFATTVSLGNTSSNLSGTTTNGYRIKFNVQDPNSPR